MRGAASLLRRHVGRRTEQLAFDGHRYLARLSFSQAGQRGNDNESQVMYTIAGLIDRTEADYPAILVVPQLPAGDS